MFPAFARHSRKHLVAPLGRSQSAPSRRLRRCTQYNASALRRHSSSSNPLKPNNPAAELSTFGSYSVILPPEPFVWGVSHIIPRSVPPGIPHPPYTQEGNECGRESPRGSQIKLGGREEARIREAAQLARSVRDFSGSMPGVTTHDIDEAVHDFIVARGAYPSPLRYQGFPKSCCTSINNVAAHGIPDSRPLEEGDIINIDITVYLNGYHGDTSQTYLVGNVNAQGRELVELTNEALEAGIRVCGPGRPFKAIGGAIQGCLKGKNVCISSALTGHGIGTAFHKPPWIIHHRNDEPGVMQPGDCFTIEPCIIQGTDQSVWIFPDGWTISTENCARSAQAEHMVLITDQGYDVLTR
ncbi:methionine aminopeptidase [Fistulina hepatica ATCC 64428]|uniref:Methionine aminopeptidase n=1 Tax=Fistulina hepatica ATCC 64428 TaxID=1128425 RepID=A0A0D7AE32_9AGAR|nr:methionine aminopeptidase [Fistulina hepatica ATCC 64428]